MAIVTLLPRCRIENFQERVRSFNTQLAEVCIDQFASMTDHVARTIYSSRAENAVAARGPPSSITPLNEATIFGKVELDGMRFVSADYERLVNTLITEIKSKMANAGWSNADDNYSLRFFKTAAGVNDFFAIDFQSVTLARAFFYFFNEYKFELTIGSWW